MTSGLDTISIHALRRTSPLGEAFVGRCLKCGAEGITLAVQRGETCPVPDKFDGESIMLAIEEGGKCEPR